MRQALITPAIMIASSFSMKATLSCHKHVQPFGSFECEMLWKHAALLLNGLASHHGAENEGTLVEAQ